MSDSSKNILVVLGHPQPNGLCGLLADNYRLAATSSGGEVQMLRLGDLKFDPVLRTGYDQIHEDDEYEPEQQLEPDLLMAQEMILWAEHLVFVYPLWWGGMPGLMKGFIDRVFLPGFSFRFRKGSTQWDKLLAGRSGRVIVTVDNFVGTRWMSETPGSRQMRKNVLEFCGVSPVEITQFGPLREAQATQRDRWFEEVRQLGSKWQ